MPKSKSKSGRKPHSGTPRRPVRRPAILDRLNVSDASINAIMRNSRMSLMRFRFGTATPVDACALFTLISVSQLLTQNFVEGPELRRMFSRAVMLLAAYNRKVDLTPDERAEVVESFQTALELWGKCSVEEVLRASREIRDGKHSLEELFPKDPENRCADDSRESRPHADAAAA